MPNVARHMDLVECGARLISGAVKTYCNGRLVVRLGDGSTHGGIVITASDTVTAEGPGVARIGDLHDCPIHGVTPIVEGSGNVFSG